MPRCGDQPCIWPDQFVDVRRLQLPVGHGGMLRLLLPWRYYLQQPFASTARMTAGMALAGLLAGWLSENTSAGMLVCLVLAGAVVFKRERRLPAWMATGLAGGAGWVCFAHHRARQL